MNLNPSARNATYKRNFKRCACFHAFRQFQTGGAGSTALSAFVCRRSLLRCPPFCAGVARSAAAASQDLFPPPSRRAAPHRVRCGNAPRGSILPTRRNTRTPRTPAPAQLPRPTRETSRSELQRTPRSRSWRGWLRRARWARIPCPLAPRWAAAVDYAWPQPRALYRRAAIPARAPRKRALWRPLRRRTESRARRRPRNKPRFSNNK